MARRGSKKSGWRLRKRNNKNKTRRGGEDGLSAASSSDPIEVSDVQGEDGLAAASSGDAMDLSDDLASPAEAELDQTPPADAELEEAIDDMEPMDLDDEGVGPEIGDVEQEQTGGKRRRRTQKRRQTKRSRRNKKGGKTRRAKRTKTTRSRSRK